MGLRQLSIGEDQNKSSLARRFIHCGFIAARMCLILIGGYGRYAENPVQTCYVPGKDKMSLDSNVESLHC